VTCLAEKWLAKAIAQVRAPLPPGAYISKFLTFVLEIPKRNEDIANTQLKDMREGCVLDPTLVTFPSSWVHKPNSRFVHVDVDIEAKSD
jgi:hypothetical protein